jgi:hypothetical protein
MNKYLLIAFSLATLLSMQTAHASEDMRMSSHFCEGGQHSEVGITATFSSSYIICPMMRMADFSSPTVLYADVDLFTSTGVTQSEVYIHEYDDDGSFEASWAPTSTLCVSSTRRCHDWTNVYAVLATSNMHVAVAVSNGDIVYSYSTFHSGIGW